MGAEDAAAADAAAAACFAATEAGAVMNVGEGAEEARTADGEAAFMRGESESDRVVSSGGAGTCTGTGARMEAERGKRDDPLATRLGDEV